MRSLHSKLTERCDIYALVDNTVPGNTPTVGVEKTPSQTNIPCSKEKDKASISPTAIGDVPVITEIFILPPDIDIKENYRIRYKGNDYTVIDAKLFRRFRKRPHHIEVTVRKRS